jgi:hypothetical protein
VKEVFQLGGRVSELVPSVVEQRLKEKQGATLPVVSGRRRRRVR